MSKTLTPRGKALHRASRTRGITEQPAGSNSDQRKDGIHVWQRECANGAAFLDRQPWCGVRIFDVFKHAGVKGITSRLASVALIEDDARAHHGPFRGWVDGPHVLAAWQQGKLLRGDALVLFGRGVHVALLREIRKINGVWCAITDEGNTSSGPGGSQDNGGGTFRRVRPLNAVHGAALVDYPDHPDH